MEPSFPVLACACAGIVVCAPRMARAEDPPSAPAAPGPHSYEVADGEVIVVEGEDADVTAASERRVGHQEIALTPRRSADDLLRLVPGLHVAPHAAEGKAPQIFLRGFDALHGADLEVRVAGVPINEPSNVHGHGYLDLGFVLPEVVRSLAAVKGSFDLEQGDFATAGSVRYELGVPAGERGSRLGYEVGTTGRHRIVGVVAPVDAPEETFVAAEAMIDGGYGELRDASRASALGQHRVELPRGPALELLAAVHAARFGEPAPVPEAGYRAGRYGFYDSPTDGGVGSSRRFLAGARLGGRRSEVRLDLQARRLALRENFTGYLLDPERGDLRDQRHDALSAGLSARWRRPLTGWLAAVGLAEARALTLSQTEEQVDAAGEPWQPTRALDAGQLSAAAALGGRLRRGRLALDAGLRIDARALRATDRLEDASSTDELVTASPRLSLAFGLGPGASLFAGYGHGVRPPEARAIAAGDAGAATSRAAELGGRTRLGPLELAATGFATWISDEMVFDHVTGTNLARSATRRLGVEAELELRPASWAALRVDLTAVDARFTGSGQPVPGAPRLLARGEARVWHRSGWRGGAQLTALGGRPLAHGARAAGFAVVDLIGAYRRDRYELGVQIDNLLGSRWRESEFHYPSRFDPGEPPSQIPRLHFSAGRPFGVRAALTLLL